MFFFLSKLLDIAVDPLWWAVLPMLCGVVLLARGARRRLALTLASLGLGALVVFSLPLVADGLWRSLERTAMDTSKPGTTYDAVVLLGGVVSPAGSSRAEPAWNDNIERVLTTHRVLAEGRAKVVIVSGGALGAGLLTEAEYVKGELVRLGIAPERIVVEPAANNTRENALESKKLLEGLGARQVLVVTSAFHVARAQGCFRAVGLEPDFLPVDYRLRASGPGPQWAPRADYLSVSSRALREWLGRLVYAVLGYTK